MKRTSKVIAAGVAGVLALVASTAMWLGFTTPGVDRVPLTPPLIDADSSHGRRMLQNASASADYAPLAAEFVAQNRRAFCGVATSVTVINALLRPQPRLTQETLFTPAAKSVRSELATSMSGMTLAQLRDLLESHGVAAHATYAADSSAARFREVVTRTLSDSKDFLVVNYDRRALEQEGAGHISPLAAYDQQTDAVLILDVAAHKYPYTWVPLPALWAAMNTIDSASDRTRGYVLVGAPRSAEQIGRAERAQ